MSEMRDEKPKSPSKRAMFMPLTYAIGDVHGRSDLLQAILDFVERDAADRGRPPRIVLLGDIVDRGHDSKGCLDVVGRLLADHPTSVFLRGNHDDWFLRYLEGDRREIRTWFHNGGMETLDSYTNLDVDEARRLILEEHSSHLGLLRRSSLMVDESPFAFVHAGIRPGAKLGDQSPNDLMWIREPFFSHHGRLDRVVVHGHSVIEEGRPMVTENRISMDTAACWSGRLSVLMIDQEAGLLSFHQTDGDHRSVVEVEPIRHDRGLGTVLDDLTLLGG